MNALVPPAVEIHHHWNVKRKAKQVMTTLYTSKFSMMESKQVYRSFKRSTT